MIHSNRVVECCLYYSLITSVRSMINADEVNATAKKNTILLIGKKISINKMPSKGITLLNLRQNYSRRHEISK